MKKNTTAPFDIAAHLDSDAVIAAYLGATADDPNPDVFLSALGYVAKARGMADIAKQTGLGRESLYKSLAAGAKPRYETIRAILRAMGLEFRIAQIGKPAKTTRRKSAACPAPLKPSSRATG